MREHGPSQIVLHCLHLLVKKSLCWPADEVKGLFDSAQLCKDFSAVCMRACVRVCVHMCMCVCVCVCVCVHVCV